MFFLLEPGNSFTSKIGQYIFDGYHLISRKHNFALLAKISEDSSDVVELLTLNNQTGESQKVLLSFSDLGMVLSLSDFVGVTA